MYTAFGRTGNLIATYNLGRSATHEVGHWMNLRHIWGDANCRTDLVADTRRQIPRTLAAPHFRVISKEAEYILHSSDLI
ncbi:MAG: hypothetical protein ABI863_19455 [Ginsengibacter sp.]